MSLILQRAVFAVGLCSFYSIQGGEVYAQEQAQDLGDAQTGSSYPLNDDNVPSMFYGGITPEEAEENARQLQEMRLSDPNAELPIQVPQPDYPKFPALPFTLEQAPDGSYVKYAIYPDGTKVELPPTIAILRAAYGPEAAAQANDPQFNSFARANTAAVLSLASLIPARLNAAVLQYLSAIVQSVIFPNSTSPFTVPTPYVCLPPISETCMYATYGIGAGTDIGNFRVLDHDGYDYAPSVIRENGKYRMWWCGDGHLSGDRIFYSESSVGLHTGWTTPVVVYDPPGVQGDFDGIHACDPTVVHVGGMYYMYYSGSPVCVPDPHGGCLYDTNGEVVLSGPTGIGVLSSTNGMSWQKPLQVLPNPNPPMIYTQHYSPVVYGAGQPSAVYVDGYFYITYGDGTGGSPGGQMAIRSVDPLFQSYVEEWTGAGTWTVRGTTASVSTNFAYVTDTINADWVYSPSTQEFIVAVNGVIDKFASLGETGPGTKGRGDASSVRFFNKNLTQKAADVRHVRVQWMEGPGLTHCGNGSILADADDCSAKPDVTCSNLHLRIINPGRDWDSAAVGPPSADPRSNVNPCEVAYHSYCMGTGPLITPLECNSLNFEGWDKSTGASLCKDWTTNPSFAVGRTPEDDYDGDGISDPVIWRPGAGNWWSRRSQNGAIVGVNWGLPGDSPIFGADYDVDRVADPAVKRGSNFYIRTSTGACPPPMVPLGLTLGCFWASPWGASDVPLPADFSGDGATDIAARSLSGNIYYIPSSGSSCAPGFTSTTYSGVLGCFSLAGTTGDKPLVANFDTDQYADRAFHRPSTGQIFVYLSSGSTTTTCSAQNMLLYSSGGPCYTNMNSTSDIPVTADFNGDGRTDIMWWNPSDQKFRTWSVSGGGGPPNFSFASGQYCYQFGANGDIPLAKRFYGGAQSEPLLVRPSNYNWVISTTGINPPSNTWTQLGGAIWTTQWGQINDRVEGLR